MIASHFLVGVKNYQYRKLPPFLGDVSHLVYEFALPNKLIQEDFQTCRGFCKKTAKATPGLKAPDEGVRAYT